MRLRTLPLYLLAMAVALTGCSQRAERSPSSTPEAAAPARPALGVKPFGTADENFTPDYGTLPPEVAKVFEHIDTNIDQHAETLREHLQQPSISNSGEGVPETAEMVKGYYEELGCQTARVYDVGITEYGSPGNPVVYAKCDEGSEKKRSGRPAAHHEKGDRRGALRVREDDRATQAEDDGGQVGLQILIGPEAPRFASPRFRAGMH